MCQNGKHLSTCSYAATLLLPGAGAEPHSQLPGDWAQPLHMASWELRLPKYGVNQVLSLRASAQARPQPFTIPIPTYHRLYFLGWETLSSYTGRIQLRIYITFKNHKIKLHTHTHIVKEKFYNVKKLSSLVLGPVQSCRQPRTWLRHICSKGSSTEAHVSMWSFLL